MLAFISRSSITSVAPYDTDEAAVKERESIDYSKQITLSAAHSGEILISF